jgi:hypothetical protein
MELNINELDLDYADQSYFMETYDQVPIQSSFEDIPENTVHKKVIKKGVRFDEPIRPMNQAFPKENSKIVRPRVPNLKPQISYEDIMSKMGMFVADGKLHLMDNDPKIYKQIKNQQQQQNQYQQQQQNQYQQQQQNQQQQQQNQYQQQQQNQYQQQYQQQQNQGEQYHAETNVPPNSYIYNKFFKEELQPQNTVRRPLTNEEYKRKVLEDFIQRQRVNQMKSKKLIMPTANINMSSGNPGNLNKLFNFSKR